MLPRTVAASGIGCEQAFLRMVEHPVAGTLIAVPGHVTTDCGVCGRSLLVGEQLRVFLDQRHDRQLHVCGLCGDKARRRGLVPEAHGAPQLRVHPSGEVADAIELEPAPMQPPAGIARPAQRAPKPVASPDLIEQLGRAQRELERVRRESSPAQLAQQRRLQDQQAAEIESLRAALRQRDQRIERLQNARIAETRPMQMCGHALDAWGQAPAAERMARIARTLGDPVVSVQDCGPGIPRIVRITLSWDIAWYEFEVKLDLGIGKASVHEVGSGGDPSDLPKERRRPNAAWRDSGLVLQ
jgi:hypothetical protein